MTKAELERRPPLLIALALILGISIPSFTFNLAFLLFVFLLRNPRLQLLFLVCTGLGVLIAPPPPPEFIKAASYIDSSWRVVSLPSPQLYGQNFVVEREGVRLYAALLSKRPICPGSTIWLQGVAKPPSESSDDYFRSQRLLGKITLKEDQLKVLEDGPWYQQLGLTWRNRFLQLAEKELGRRSAGEFGALVFNTNGLLDDGTKEALKSTGTAHLISASGLHVVVIATGLFWLLSFLPVSRVVQISIAIGILLLYAIATGMDPPVVRSILISTLSYTAWLIRREPDWPSALGLSAIVCIFWQPNVVFSIGFQLSFMVVLLLHMFLLRGSGARFRPEGKFLQAVQGSVIAAIATAPLIAYQFGFISPISVLANVLVVVAVAPIVWVGIAAVPLSMVWATAASVLILAVSPCIIYIDSVVNYLGGAWVLNFPEFSAYWLVLIYGLAIALWRPHVRPA